MHSSDVLSSTFSWHLLTHLTSAFSCMPGITPLLPQHAHAAPPVSNRSTRLEPVLAPFLRTSYFLPLSCIWPGRTPPFAKEERRQKRGVRRSCRRAAGGWRQTKRDNSCLASTTTCVWVAANVWAYHRDGSNRLLLVSGGRSLGGLRRRAFWK